ncbi:hypothetical protein WH47_06785 [Habropoda laboriosa]|uniref:Uncharacterized protein n=1 Tax=Habropoda laboriosa TaxID=597456 RepID=A0A0L7RIQ4_9HYME|nr:hypothetical protein WH47_06785 [Habropoda laboriosa]
MIHEWPGGRSNPVGNQEASHLRSGVQRRAERGGRGGDARRREATRGSTHHDFGGFPSADGKNSAKENVWDVLRRRNGGCREEETITVGGKKEGSSETRWTIIVKREAVFVEVVDDSESGSAGQRDAWQRRKRGSSRARSLNAEDTQPETSFCRGTSKRHRSLFRLTFDSCGQAGRSVPECVCVRCTRGQAVQPSRFIAGPINARQKATGFEGGRHPSQASLRDVHGPG